MVDKYQLIQLCRDIRCLFWLLWCHLKVSICRVVSSLIGQSLCPLFALSLVNLRSSLVIHMMLCTHLGVKARFSFITEDKKNYLKRKLRKLKLTLLKSTICVINHKQSMGLTSSHQCFWKKSKWAALLGGF